MNKYPTTKKAVVWFVIGVVGTTFLYQFLLIPLHDYKNESQPHLDYKNVYSGQEIPLFATNVPDDYTNGITILRATKEADWPIDGQTTTFHQLDGSYLQFDSAYLGDELAYRTGWRDFKTGKSVWHGWHFFPNLKELSSSVTNSFTIKAIQVGSSPFNWTNNSGKNIFVFIDRNSASTISVNGSKILSSTGDATIPLQNGEWITVVYTNAPEMKWKPF